MISVRAGPHFSVDVSSADIQSYGLLVFGEENAKEEKSKLLPSA